MIRQAGGAKLLKKLKYHSKTGSQTLAARAKVALANLAEEPRRRTSSVGSAFDLLSTEAGRRISEGAVSVGSHTPRHTTFTSPRSPIVNSPRTATTPRSALRPQASSGRGVLLLPGGGSFAPTPSKLSPRGAPMPSMSSPRTTSTNQSGNSYTQQDPGVLPLHSLTCEGMEYDNAVVTPEYPEDRSPPSPLEGTPPSQSPRGAFRGKISRTFAKLSPRLGSTNQAASEQQSPTLQEVAEATPYLSPRAAARAYFGV
jgi:hypothetical protein